MFRVDIYDYLRIVDERMKPNICDHKALFKNLKDNIGKRTGAGAFRRLVTTTMLFFSYHTH
jgi:hypothetical protein